MRTLLILCAFSLCIAQASAQPYGEPDRGQPGDETIQAYLAKEALRLDEQLKDDHTSLETWQANRERYREEYLYMLGLWPLPERTDLKATITGTLERDGYVVEKMHYQSKPGLYVTANLYRPKDANPGEKFPAVLYVCGHSNGGRNGSKTPYMAHPIWLAKHGFICLIVDTLELGEIIAPGIHHGTYNLERWWWQSRGYTPAGVECWNGVRGIDYLLSRDDVNPENLGVTGISGGGAATFWIAAADERIKVAIPVSGMADLESYVGNRVINGHCDCMFLYNTFQWPWTRIAGLIAPRPMLFVNSDNDAIFPMDANERITNRMERLYSLYGASDRFDTVVSVGGHAYREDIRRAAFAFLQYHLQGKADAITDSEIDLVDNDTKPPTYPIPPEQLRVFPTDADLPTDAINVTIDEHFVPIATPELPKEGEYAAWREKMLAELRRVVFRSVPDPVPAAEYVDEKPDPDGPVRFTSPDGVVFSIRLQEFFFSDRVHNTMVVLNDDDFGKSSDWKREIPGRDQLLLFIQPRGSEFSHWTRKNPPNYVERSCALLGRTADSGRILDILSWLNGIPQSKKESEKKEISEIAGRGRASLIAAYVAVLHDRMLQQVTLIDPPTTHMDPAAPQFLNILRVCDVPDMLGLIAPRPLKIVTKRPEAFERTRKIFRAAGAEDKLTIETSGK
jgi:hypothetical protein